ncbi:MAG: [protein-PII] uridylyltransferase [Pseudomonadota bacterium]
MNGHLPPGQVSGQLSDQNSGQDFGKGSGRVDGQAPVPDLPQQPGSPPGPWRIENIVDGRSLRTRLTAAAQTHIGDADEQRRQALDLLHGALFRGRMIAQERLEQGADGLDTARLLSAVQDEVIGALYDFIVYHVYFASNPTDGERIAVCATGGYGRGVLAPSSDIDLLVLTPNRKNAHAESVLEYMLYALWDIGLKVGHAFRTVEECVRLSKEDVTIQTSLLDARFLCGEPDLFEGLQQRFAEQCVRGREATFIADKLAERDRRHARQGDTRYVVEPNVKEGKGALRDLQTLFWIQKFLEGGTQLEDVMERSAFTRQDYRRYIRAARFLWTVRCHIHFVTGRPEERLSFDLQPEIAARMGYEALGEFRGVERFMKQYFRTVRDVGNLTRVLSAKLEADQQKQPEGLRRFLPRSSPKALGEDGFTIDSGRLSIDAPERFADNPALMVRMFALAAQEELDVHPDALWGVQHNQKLLDARLQRRADVREAFFDALLGGDDPARTLRRMNEADILGRVVPEFGGIVGQTQFNMYHAYTVDEHTLRAVQAVSDIEHGRFDRHGLPSKVFGDVIHRRALYLAMLLHDTGKGLGDQQIAGEKTARRASRRLGLGPAEVDLVGWLVRHHLVMSDTAQRRDIADPRTVSVFAQEVGDLERLRLLYILTVADICAVGPNVWNAWKGQLLADLYHNTAAALRGGRTDERSVVQVLEQRAEQTRAALAEQRPVIPAPMPGMEPAYWAGFDVDDLVWHADELAGDAPVTVAWRQAVDQRDVELLISCQDRPRLFADIVGTVLDGGANIASAQVFTNPDGRIVDVFVLQAPDGGVFADGDPDRLERLGTALEEALLNGCPTRDIAARNTKREAAFIVEPVVQIRNDLSVEFTVVEIIAREQHGLLYDVAQLLADEALTIHSAHVGSYGERVFDTFYVARRDGQKLAAGPQQDGLRSQLLAILGRDDPGAPTTPAKALRRATAADSF